MVAVFNSPGRKVLSPPTGNHPRGFNEPLIAATCQNILNDVFGRMRPSLSLAGGNCGSVMTSGSVLDEGVRLRTGLYIYEQ